MGHIEWNYDNANVGGKNVFVFRDTNHAHTPTQDKIVDQIEWAMNKGFFKHLFVEGLSGNYLPEIDPRLTEEQYKKSLISRRTTYLAFQIVSFRQQKLNNRSNILFGVDDKKTLEEQLVVLKKHVELVEKSKIKRLNSLEEIELIGLNQRSDRLTEQRSIFAANAIRYYMDSWNVKTAGFVYGEGHFDQTSEELRKRGVGYITYFPGEVIPDEKTIVEYIRAL